MKILSNRFTIVLYCVVMNLMFEYMARGARSLSQPLFYLFLAGIYAAFFSILEDLIVRFRLTNLQIGLFAAFWSLYPTTFITGNLINPNTYFGLARPLGLNWGALLFIVLLTWPVLQSNLSMYFANRLQPRDWSHPRMGPIGYAVALLYLAVMPILARSSRQVELTLTPRAVFFVVLLMIVFLGLFAVTLYRREPVEGPPPTFESLPFMDFLTFGSVILMLLLGTFFQGAPTASTARPLGQTAVVLQHTWLAFSAIAFLLYRLWRRRPIVV